MIHIGKAHEAECKISVTQYNPDKLIQQDNISINELDNFTHGEAMTWVNIDGLSNTDVIESIGIKFNIHPLTLEDILSTHQRPKLEEYGNYLYLVIKGVRSNHDKYLDIQYEQISILLMEHYVITFKERTDDIFNPICKRLENQKSSLRKMSGDYLTYAIVDIIVDEYFVVQDSLDNIIDPLEDSLSGNLSNDTFLTIQKLRRELIIMKRSISPLRELLTEIQHSNSDLLKEETLRFFSDVRDHVLRVLDSLESYRERIVAMHDIYLTSINNKINETMKILTIFASIFIPLTFISGIYGMNFEYMPELKWHWAYPVLWLIFIGITLALLAFFKKKKWF